MEALRAMLVVACLASVVAVGFGKTIAGRSMRPAAVALTALVDLVFAYTNRDRGPTFVVGYAALIALALILIVVGTRRRRET